MSLILWNIGILRPLRASVNAPHFWYFWLQRPEQT
jgi:hypothetical protein